jgi:PAS domain S-box-containing protein
MAIGRPIEEALRLTEERFRLLVESVRDYAIFILDPNGIVSSWNIGAERIKGYKADEIVGQSFAKFYPPEDVASGKLERELDIARREGRYEEDGWRVRKDGSKFWAHVVITALRDPGGEVVGFAKVTQDLTERVRAEKQRATLAQNEHTTGLLGRLLGLSGALAAAQTPQDVAEVAVVTGLESLGARTASFFRVDDDDMLLVAAKGLEPDVAEKWRKVPASLDTPMGASLRTRTVQFAETHVVALPLESAGEVVAVVAYQFDPRPFPEEERALLRTLAAQIGQALDRATAYLREREAHDRLAVLMELSNGLSRTLTVDDVARVVIERGMMMSRADTCTLYTYDEAAGVLHLIGERGCSPEIIERIRRIDTTSVSPIYATVQTRRALFAETAEEYAKLVPEVARMTASGPRAQAFWSSPLIAEGRPIGLLGMGFYEPRRIPPEMRNLVEAFSRQCAEAMLRATRLETERFSRARLATTLRSIGDAVIATDVNGAVTMMNPVAEKATQWPEAEARGRPLAEVFRIVNEQTRAVVQSPVDKVLELGAIVGLANHTVLVRRDGTELPIEDSGAPIKAEESAPVEGVVLVFRDVAEQKAAEARRTFLAEATATLAESLEYQVTLARVARLAVPRLADWCAVDIVTDEALPKRLAVAHVDPAKVKYAHELEQKYPSDPNAPTGVPNVLRTGKSELYSDIPDELLVASTKDAEHLRVARELGLRSAMIVPLVARGRTLGAITFVMAESGRRYDTDDLAFADDLARRFAIAIENAELYRAERSARQSADVANRAKDEFLAIVSHELRTPLNAILGWAKLMSQREFDEARRARAVETIERNAVAMAQLIEDLLDMSRIVSGKMRIDPQPVSLDAVVAAALDSIKPAADAKGIEITTHLHETIPTVLGDAARLQQVVWNLLSNAVKFTAKGGHVDVTASTSSDAAIVRVKDDGVGIARDFLPYVFDPFSQEDARITRARGGLGLGLAITRQLVELHGGRIEVTSEGEGRGATFTLALPIRPHDEQRAESTAEMRGRVSSPALHNLRVLVIDDERDARELVQAILADRGCDVTLASSVDEGLAILDTRLPDVVLADISMPNRDGYDFIRELRARTSERGGDLPAAALTAYARAEDKTRMLAAGYSLHVPKPIDPNELVDVVASLTQFRRA